MDNKDENLTIGSDQQPDDSSSGTSTFELGKVKRVLSIKMEKPSMHYKNLTPMGMGSFGEVHCALDTLLGREVAIKSLKSQFREEEEILDRFLKEARGTAQLEHPNIMPVHEIGATDELGIYFTMKKIEGETLKEVLDHLDQKTSLYLKKYTRDVLLGIFQSVCNGMAFAHSKGVIHRDLKPANIMIGDYGEVLILDWGLVKKLGIKEDASHHVQLHMDEFNEGDQTLDGAVSGTPNYMSPEQADGRIKDVGFHSDIYSMGAILYHILAYVPPFEKTQIRQLLENVKIGRFEAPRKRRPALKIPKELNAICLKAMSLYPLKRYGSIAQLSQDVSKYLGHFEVSAYKAPQIVNVWRTCKRNPIKSSVAAGILVALTLGFSIQRVMVFGIYSASFDQAEQLYVEGDQLVDQACAVYDELTALQRDTELKVKTDQEVKLQVELVQLERKVAAKFNVAEVMYKGIPEPYNQRQEVHDGFVNIMRQRINFALYRKQYDQAREWLATVRLRIKQPGVKVGPDVMETLALIEQRIDGLGSLEITGPENIREVMVWPVFDGEIRKVMGDAVKRGTLPINLPAIKKGSYVLTIKREGGGILPYPIYVNHSEDKKVELAIPDSIPAGMVYVPGGTFIYGGKESRFYRENRRSLPGFFINKYEVVFSEYLEFWKGLPDGAKKKAYTSRIRFHTDDRTFVDGWNAEGILTDERLQMNHPVVGITLDAAKAFCEWKSKQVGELIRLPTAEEWEKAARGVDGRKYVWGNGFNLAENLTLTYQHKKADTPVFFRMPPGSFKSDLTIYNAYDMAGNVREMTSSLLPGSDVLYQIKGGSGSTPPAFLPCCYASDTPVVPSDVGFRYIQEISVR
jgi:serine/threonine protein kinase/formylglycine-generating enzyme required for sulfatase activity